MTESELLDEMFRALSPTAGGEGWTVAEIGASTGRGEASVRKRIKSGIANGTVRVTRKMIPRMGDGRLVPVSGYLFVKPKGNGSKPRGK